LPATRACTLRSFGVGAIPNHAPVTLKVEGSNLPGEDVAAEFFDITAVEADVQADSIAVSEDGATATVALADSSALVAGKRYGLRILVSGSQACSSDSDFLGVYAHALPAITAVKRAEGDSVFNAFGYDTLHLSATGLFLARDSDVHVRFGSSPAGAWTRTTSAKVVVVDDVLKVEATTPAVPIPDDWILSCPDTQRPVQSGSCIPNVAATVAFSLDGGLTFTASEPISFSYVRPVKIGFLFKSGVDDFGWSAQVNEARIEIEGMFGNTVNASTYFTNVPEGDYEPLQENKGSTFSTNTEVPQFFTLEDGTVRENAYYTGVGIMKRMCDEDFDFIIPTTYGFSKMALDMADYIGCKRHGDGVSSTESYHTFFIGAGSSGGNAVMSKAYSKTFQTRYLAGLTAAFELKRQRVALVEQFGDAYVQENPPCVGFITANHGNLRGINAFILGCREVDPQCLVRIAFIGTYYHPETERDAAAFMYNVGKCNVVMQHTDSIEPQLYYRRVGAYSIGYNYDQRSFLGDSVLTSEKLFWAPIFANCVRQLQSEQRDPVRRANLTTLSEDMRYGLDKGGLGLAPYFSPVIPQYGQAYIIERMNELSMLQDDAAYHQVYCGENLVKAWQMETEDGTMNTPPLKMCGSNPEWKRIEDHSQFPWVPTHFWNQAGQQLGENDTITDTDCFTPTAALGSPYTRSTFTPDTVYMDFILQGGELFEPQETPFGSILGSRTVEDAACTGPAGKLGDRFYVLPSQFDQCDGTQWGYSRGVCNATTMKSPVVYSWLSDNITGEQLSCGDTPDIAGKYATLAELPYLEEGPPCDYIPRGSSPETIGLAFTGLGVIVNAIIIILLFKFGRHKAVRATQPVMVILMSCGGVLLCVSNLTFLGEPTKAVCIGRVIFFNLAFDSVFAILWAKIYRVNRLFAGVKKLKKVVIKQSEMIVAAFGLILIDAIILIIWAAVDPPVPRVMREVFVNLPAAGVGSLTVVECASENSIYSDLTLLYKVFLILSACALVFGAKRVPASYVEHRFIIFSAYNTAVFSGVVLLLTSSSDDPSTAFMIHCAGTCIGTIIVNGSLTIPRFLLALNIWKVETLETSSVPPNTSESRAGPLTTTRQQFSVEQTTTTTDP